MRIIIKGKHVPDRLHEYIERKVQRLSRLLNDDARVEVTISEEQTRSARERYNVQMVIASKPHPIRSEANGANATSAFDLVLDKVSSQLGRQKGRQIARKHQTPPLRVLALTRAGELTSMNEDQAPDGKPLEEEQNEAIWSRIMEIRRVHPKPMSDRQVIEQMEAHGLSFYPFYNEETNSLNVMYRLEQGGYGLLVPALEEVQ